MSDLIDRQAAIDVLEERLKANGYSNVALVSELNRSIEYLMQLPSAQPEIVRCRECRHAFINEYHEDKPLICGLTKMCGTTDPDWFCADGERREEDVEK